MASYVLSGYTTPNGVDSKDAVKAMQKQLGVTADGIWGPKTQAAYEASASSNKLWGEGTPYSDIWSVPPQGATNVNGGAAGLSGYTTYDRNGNATGTYKGGVLDPDSSIPSSSRYSSGSSGGSGGDDFTSLYNQALAQYGALPTTDKAAIRADIEAQLRPSYDLAITGRKKATDTNRAEIDVDAASRGMGASTWISDAKTRQMDSEADDISSMESNYLATLSKSIMDQLNANTSLSLQMKQAAQSVALQLMQLAIQRASLDSSGSSGGSGYTMEAPSYSSSRPSSSSGSTVSTPKTTDDSLTKLASAMLTQDDYFNVKKGKKIDQMTAGATYSSAPLNKYVRMTQ